MAGTPGNPYHDPSTGKFASASGLNVSNSTRGQRIKARVKESAKAIGEFASGTVSLAAGAIAAAAIHGASRAIRRAADEKTTDAINRASVHVAKASHKAVMAVHSATTKMPKTTAKNATTIKSHIQKQHNVANKTGGSSRSRVMELPGKFPYR